MNNEQLENEVQKKNSRGKIVFAVLGVLVLGIVSLMVGIKIFSNLSITADTGLPPIPGDPQEDPSSTVSSVAPSATVSASTSPIIPPDPEGPPIDVTIRSGWSVVSGSTLYGYSLAPITQKGIFVYSFNDPYLPNRNWIVSNDTCTNQTDFFCLSSSLIKFSPYPNVGYYVYNPGSQVTLSLSEVSTPTLNTQNAIFGRGWHLMHWSQVAATKNELMGQIAISYSDNSRISLINAVKENTHKASIKVYVIMDPTNISSSSIRELTGTDSANSLSKIPQDSYFWIYLRRTASRATNIVEAAASTNFPQESQSTTDDVLMPPVPIAP